MEKKITKREMFTKVMEVAEVKANAEMMAFLTHEVELLDKKAEKKKTTVNEEVVALMDNALEFISNANRPVTCSEVANALDISTQRMTPILTKLVADAKILKNKDKKSMVYTIA